MSTSSLLSRLSSSIEFTEFMLNTFLNNKTLQEWGKIFLKLSKEGLQKRSIKNKKDKDESGFLKNIESILRYNKTKANIAIESFDKNKSFRLGIIQP